MKKAATISVLATMLLAAQATFAIQTGKVEFGANGVYDGTVWMARNTSGSLVFRDRQVGSTITLWQLLGGQNDHGSLSGLADDDHPLYLNDARHWQTHTASYNDELPIPPDVGNNSTLGGHTGDGSIHLLRNIAETIGGAWRFTGVPVFAPSLRIEPTGPNFIGTVDFGTGYDSPRFSYLGNLNEFEFTRPIRTTSGSLTDLVGSRFRVWTNLDGRGLSGQPSATLTNFTSVNGIAAANLLSRSINEDISGQWDFLAPVRVFGNVSLTDGTASGVVTALGLSFTTQTKAAETGGKFSRIETTSHSMAVLLDKNNTTPSGWKRLRLFGGDHRTWPAWDVESTGDTGQLSFRRNSDGFQYLRMYAFPAGAVFGYCAYARTGWNANGDIENYTYSNNGSTYFRIRDSQAADVWTCNSKGNVAMAANAKQTIPDGTNAAPFILTFNAAANYYPDARQTLAPTTRTLTALEYSGNGYSYVAFPVPNDVMGAHVVLDRITVYCAQQGGAGEQIQEIALMNDSNSAVRTYSNAITADTQWLSSDYTMDDSQSYVVRMLFAQGAGGHLHVTRFKAEYHLE
jgi:hypothetical protein